MYENVSHCPTLMSATLETMLLSSWKCETSVGFLVSRGGLKLRPADSTSSSLRAYSLPVEHRTERERGEIKGVREKCNTQCTCSVGRDDVIKSQCVCQTFLEAPLQLVLVQREKALTELREV